MSDRLVQLAFDGDLIGLRALLATGDDPNEIGVATYTHAGHERRWNGLPLAAGQNNLALLEALINHGARLDAVNNEGMTPLHTAAWNAHLDAVRLFLSCGADVNARDEDDATPLFRVARCHPSRAQAVKTAEALLAAGADPRAKNREGKMASGVGINDGVRKILQKAAAKARPPAVPRERPIAPAPPEMIETPHAHAILKGALERATPDEQPATIHLGAGPTVACPAIGTIEITIWLGELVLPYVQEKEVVTAKAVLEAVRAFLVDPKDRSRHNALLAASMEGKKESAALGIVRRSAGAAATFCRGKQDLVWTGARGAAQRTIAFLREREGVMPIRAFLEELDRRILCAEMASFMKNVKPVPPEVAVARVLWRGADMRIGELANGEVGFVGKLKSRWTWTAGTLDDALACVPDAWFPIATAFVAR